MLSILLVLANTLAVAFAAMLLRRTTGVLIDLTWPILFGFW